MPTQEELRRGTNPHFGTLGFNDNCQRVVHAYEMRARGFDVTARMARPMDTWGMNTRDGWMSALDGAYDEYVQNIRRVVVPQQGWNEHDYRFYRVTADPSQHVLQLAQGWDAPARGHVVFGRGQGKIGHVFNVEWDGKELRVIEAQDPKASNMTLAEYMNQIPQSSNWKNPEPLAFISAILSDNKDFNDGVLKAVQ